MATDTNGAGKVRFGTKSAYYAVRNEDGTYGAVKRMNGVESVDLSNGTGDRQVIYADDTEYFARNGSGTMEIQVQFARFDRDFQTEVLGHKIDETTGGIVVSEDDVAKDFAFFFETTGDLGFYRTCYFSCQSSAPGFSASTNTDSISEAPETATFTAKSVPMGDGKEHISLSVEPGDTGYDDFFKAVPMTATSNPVSE